MAGTPIQVLIDEVTFRVTPDAATDPSASTRILARINWTIREIARVKQPTECEASDATQALVQNQATYNRPSDLLILKGIKLVGLSRRLRPMTLGEFNRIDEAIAGEPRRFLDRGTTIRVIPKPDAASAGTVLRIDYIKLPATQAANELCLLDARWDEAIQAGAAARYLRDNNEFERAAAALREYTALMRLHPRKWADTLYASGGRTLGLGKTSGSVS